MGNVNGLSLDLLVHPGETIKEVLEEKKMSQEELAIRTEYSPKHISEVVRGKKDISSEFANRLEYALGIPASFWMNLQSNYDKEVFEINSLSNIEEKELNILKDFGLICKLNSSSSLDINSKYFLELYLISTISNVFSFIFIDIFLFSKLLLININIFSHLSLNLIYPNTSSSFVSINSVSPLVNTLYFFLVFIASL